MSTRQIPCHSPPAYPYQVGMQVPVGKYSDCFLNEAKQLAFTINHSVFFYMLAKMFKTGSMQNKMYICKPNMTLR